MKKPDELERTYVRRVREGTQKYARDLMAENDRLRMLIAALESDRVRLAERARSVDNVLQEVDLLRRAVSTLEREKLGVQAQLFAAREELESHRQEIVVNLIGSEELGVYELEPEDATLRLVASFGIDPTAHDRIPVGEGRIGRVAATGDPDIGPNGAVAARAQEADLTACVPLKLDGRVIGALALFRLLPQKNGFESLDHELFGLLGTHAATALYCTRLQERLEARTPA